MYVNPETGSHTNKPSIYPRIVSLKKNFGNAEFVHRRREDEDRGADGGGEGVGPLTTYTPSPLGEGSVPSPPHLKNSILDVK